MKSWPLPIFTSCLLNLSLCVILARGWNHAGDHVRVGELYWNHFHYVFDGILHFHDSPDFSGVIRYPDHKPHEPYERDFYGDIGRVSPIAMMDTVQVLHPYTLWISVVNEGRQVIIERLVPKPPDMTFMPNQGFTQLPLF